MTGGMVVNRQWILELPDGRTVVDWGDGRAQDLDTGDFVDFPKDMTVYSVSEDGLAYLVKTGRIIKYDAVNVYLPSLPDGSMKTIE